MPVWAAILLPLIAFCWITWLIVGRIDEQRERHQRAESFMQWMSEERDRRA